MKIRHRPYHWLLVALVVLAALLVLSEARGQSTGSQAAFEGRPAMAGAQGGTGAQAGVPQGGIGVQGNEAAERTLRLRKPSGQERPQATSELDDLRAAHKDVTIPRKDVTVKPGRDRSVAQDQRAITPKLKRAAKRTITRARHGVSPIDSTASAPAR